MNQYDYSKLLGKMREKRRTQADLAREIGLSETSLNFSLNNNRVFKQDEITKICCALDIRMEEIPIYFFAHKL